MNWQTFLALGVVLLTLGIFAYRIVRSPKNRSACGSDCGCTMTKKR